MLFVIWNSSTWAIFEEDINRLINSTGINFNAHEKSTDEKFGYFLKSFVEILFILMRRCIMQPEKKSD